MTRSNCYTRRRESRVVAGSKYYSHISLFQFKYTIITHPGTPWRTNTRRPVDTISVDRILVNNHASVWELVFHEGGGKPEITTKSYGGKMRPTFGNLKYRKIWAWLYPHKVPIYFRIEQNFVQIRNLGNKWFSDTLWQELHFETMWSRIFLVFETIFVVLDLRGKAISFAVDGWENLRRIFGESSERMITFSSVRNTRETLFWC